MWAFVLRRFLQSLLALIILSVVTFFFTWSTGDPINYIVPLEETTPEQLEQLRHEYGLDRPLLVQYWVYIKRVVQGDFGHAIHLGRRPVVDVIESRIIPTAHLGAMAIAMVLMFGIPLGVFAAYNRGRLFDSVARTVAFAGQSIPEFFLALVLIFLVGVKLGWLPVAGREGGWQHWVLPAITAGWFSTAGLLRITRSSVLEVLGSDYVRTARAKGLMERTVLWRHTFRNSLISIVTAIALLVVGLMHGIVLVETVFGWPGLGRLVVEAVTARDLFLVQALVLLFGSMYLSASLAADILYGVVDPRVRYS
jgi:ABC-type dipeptide/oligopeptide/nickel transport system permease component